MTKNPSCEDKKIYVTNKHIEFQERISQLLEQLVFFNDVLQGTSNKDKIVQYESLFEFTKNDYLKVSEDMDNFINDNAEYFI